MSGGVRIALVSPASITELRDPRLPADQAAAMRAESAPLGILTLSSIVEQRGHEALPVDLNRTFYDYLHRKEGLSGSFVTHVAEQLSALEADVVGFSTMWSTYPFTLRVAQVLKRRRPGVTVLLGGPQASVVDLDTLDRFDDVDLVLRGEADETLPMLLDALATAGPLRVPGLSHRSKGNVVREPDAPLPSALDDNPPPAFQLFDDARAGGHLPIEVGRGCPFGCSFCSTNDFFSRRYRLKSPARVLDEMSDLNRRFGVTRFDLVHDMFTAHRPSVTAFCDVMLEAGAPFQWFCSARTDCVDEQLLDHMQRAGCRGIFFGVESGSAEIQLVAKKRLDLDVAKHHVMAAAAKRMQTTLSLIVGFPDEQREDLRGTVDFLLETLQEDYVDPQIHILTPLSATPLEAQYASRTYLDDLYPDLSHSGWVQEPADRDLIRDHPAIFGSFRSLPLTHIPRRYVQELRLFLKAGIADYRWLLVALHRATGDLLSVFDAWRQWLREQATWSQLREEELLAAYGSGPMGDWLTFVAERFAGHDPTVSAVIEYYTGVAAADREASSRPDRSDGRQLRLADGVGLQTFPAHVIHAVRSLHSLAAQPLSSDAGEVTCATRHAGPRLEVVSLTPALAALLECVAGGGSVDELLTAAASEPSRSGKAPLSAVAGYGLRLLVQEGLVVVGDRETEPAPAPSHARSYAGH